MIPHLLRGVDRRLLMAGAGLVGVLLGLVLLVTVFGGDDGAAEPALPPRPVPAPVAEVKVPEKPAPLEPATVLPGQDPFRQLASVPKAQASGQAPGSGPAPFAAPAVAATSASPAGDASTTASLVLKSIAKDSSGVARANITVDGKSYSLAQGEVFSYGYRLERVEGTCVEVSAQGARAQMCVPSSKP